MIGISHGGLFTLYAMFTDPGLISGYISASPAVQYDNGFCFKQEKDFAGAHKDLRVCLFISVGSIATLTQPDKDFMQILKGRPYAGLKMECRVIEGERHAGNKP